MIATSLAVLFTGNGISVTLLAKDEEKGRERYRTYYNDLIQRGLVTKEQAEHCEKLLSFTQDYSGISEQRVIFECIIEDLELKHCVYDEIERNCKSLLAIASTTSSISPIDLGKKMVQKEKIMATHPWSPPHLVPCVELVKNDFTAPESVKAVKDILEYCGREVAFMNKPAPGFIGNRLQHALYREAVYMIEQGICGPEDIDKTIRTSFGPRYTSIGLFEHFDYAGLDMVLSIEDYLFPTLSNAVKTQDYIRERVERGDLGCKTGEGVYNWKERDMDAFRNKASEPYLKFFNWKLPKV
jgi:3-hydroxybutyryl-CoA dehydrogenase